MHDEDTQRAIENATEVLGVAVQAPPDAPVVILVIDDTDDDEMISIFANENIAPSPNYAGAWAGDLQILPGDEGIASTRFHLVRFGGGFERCWKIPAGYTDPIIRVAPDTAHTVILVSTEMVGEMGEILDIAKLRSGLFVAIDEPSDALRALRRRLPRYRDLW